MTPLRLVKKLVKTAEISPPDEFFLRPYGGPDDITVWLEIHAAVFVPLARPGRLWTEADFRREFLEKPGWQAGAMWFACQQEKPIGTVTWTPMERSRSVAMIRWLAVLPDWRRQDVATYLMQTVERLCLEQGHAVAEVETLPSWESAVTFYQARGYESK